MHNERLRSLLLERGHKPEDLAAAIDVDPKTVERWITKARVPYRRHRYATAAFLGVDEPEIWPSAPTSAQVASASENEMAAFYPHRWAVPRETWQRLFDRAQHDIGILVYSAMFLAEDQGAIRTLARKAATGIQVRILMGDPDSQFVAQQGADEGIDEGMAARIRKPGLAVQFHQQMHLKVGDRTCDQRQQRHAPGRRPPDPASGVLRNLLGITDAANWAEPSPGDPGSGVHRPRVPCG
jgi:lambda repressor-like predicted transcriptional regulator